MPNQVFPEPTVGAFIFSPQGELLLVQSHKWHDKWVVPGGHVELGETLEQALVREALEETGLEVYDLKFINSQEFIFDRAFWRRKHFIFFDFACRSVGRDVTLNNEAQAHAWVMLDQALEMDVDSYTRNSLVILLGRRV
jgi:nucleoside triphosphatase